MLWQLPWRADPQARRLADRHYSRRRPGSAQFVPPGRCLVLRTPAADALWVSLLQDPRWVRHAWAAAWVCCCFRNESAHRSSDLIRQAVAAARWAWGQPPPDGFVTFVDPRRVRPQRDPGRCFRKAGWRPRGHTAGGLVVLQLPPASWPAPERLLRVPPWLWPLSLSEDS
jgi:hypothetical protein